MRSPPVPEGDRRRSTLGNAPRRSGGSGSGGGTPPGSNRDSGGTVAAREGCHRDGSRRLRDVALDPRAGHRGPRGAGPADHHPRIPGPRRGSQDRVRTRTGRPVRGSVGPSSDGSSSSSSSSSWCWDRPRFHHGRIGGAVPAAGWRFQDGRSGGGPPRRPDLPGTSDPGRAKGGPVRLDPSGGWAGTVGFEPTTPGLGIRCTDPGCATCPGSPSRPPLSAFPEPTVVASHARPEGTDVGKPPLNPRHGVARRRSGGGGHGGMPAAGPASASASRHPGRPASAPGSVGGLPQPAPVPEFRDGAPVKPRRRPPPSGRRTVTEPTGIPGSDAAGTPPGRAAGIGGPRSPRPVCPAAP